MAEPTEADTTAPDTTEAPTDAESTSDAESSAPAADSADCVVINEIFPHGGSGAAVVTHRFVELHNTCAEEVSLDGWSLQYRARTSTGAPSTTVPLTGAVPAEGHYLIQGGGNNGAGDPLPDPDATSGAGIGAAAGGTYILATTNDPLQDLPVGSVDDHAQIADLVGYHTTNTFRGSPALGASTSESLHRHGEDTGDNSADFAPEAPTPTNSAGASLGNPGTGDGDDPEEGDEPEDENDDGGNQPDPEDGLTQISSIRGAAGDSPAQSPLLGDQVTVEGYVSARYSGPEDSRSHDGFYLQQGGACGEEDYSTHEVSCAIFVWMGTAWDGAGVALGDYVQVTGTVATWQETGATESSQLQLTRAEVETLNAEDAPLPSPEPFPYAEDTTVAERERLIGMLIAPQGEWTVTDNYGLLHGELDNVGGVLGIVSGPEPLYTPTAVTSPGEEAEALARANAEALITLGHGGRSRWTDWAFENHLALPYLHADQTVRVGAGLTWQDAVVLEHRYDGWRFEPREFVPGDRDAEPVDIENTREAVALPEPAADLRLAGFNVLNYFPHTGEMDPECTSYFTDRFGDPTTTRDCTARGAYSGKLFDVQQNRIVNTILEMDADVVALQEVENSVHFNGDRDWAHQQLVDALNNAETDQQWDYVSVDSVPENEDVIRNGFLYRPDAVEAVDARILHEDGVADLESSALDGVDLAEVYSNAREPMAAVFQPVDGSEDDQFIAIVNHFKSKGCSNASGANQDQGDGQSCYNPDRVEQAQGLALFSEALTDHYGIEQIYLMGDFNAHAFEDPMQALYDAEFENLTGEQSSYMFAGQLGALDHIVASPQAADAVEQAVIWNTNAREPIALEYSRYQASGTPDLYGTDEWNTMTWRASDHDPIVADIRLSASDNEDPTDPEDPDDHNPGEGDDGGAHWLDQVSQHLGALLVGIWALLERAARLLRSNRR